MQTLLVQVIRNYDGAIFFSRKANLQSAVPMMERAHAVVQALGEIPQGYCVSTEFVEA